MARPAVWLPVETAGRIRLKPFMHGNWPHGSSRRRCIVTARTPFVARPGAARTRPLRRPGDANFIQCDETKGNANHTWTDSRVRRRDRRAFTHATRRGTSRLRPPITPRVIQSVHLVRTCTPWEQSCTDYGGWARMQHAACMIAHGRAYQMAAWRSQPHP